MTAPPMSAMAAPPMPAVGADVLPAASHRAHPPVQQRPIGNRFISDSAHALSLKLVDGHMDGHSTIGHIHDHPLDGHRHDRLIDDHVRERPSRVESTSILSMVLNCSISASSLQLDHGGAMCSRCRQLDSADDDDGRSLDDQVTTRSALDALSMNHREPVHIETTQSAPGVRSFASPPSTHDPMTNSINTLCQIPC